MHQGAGDAASTAEWETPPEVWEPLHKEFRFGVDLTGGPGTQHRLPLWIGPGSPIGVEDLAETKTWSLDLSAGPGYSNPPYGPFIAQVCMPFALAARNQGWTTVWLLPFRCTEAFKRVMMPQANEIRIVDGRITFHEGGEPRWNRKIYNESLAAWLCAHPEGLDYDLVIECEKRATQTKTLLSAWLGAPSRAQDWPDLTGDTVPAWPTYAEMHAAATKRPDPAPFDSMIVVFRPERPKVWGAEFKLWSFKGGKR
jgi:hypothetical protein